MCSQMLCLYSDWFHSTILMVCFLAVMLKNKWAHILYYVYQIEDYRELKNWTNFNCNKNGEFNSVRFRKTFRKILEWIVDCLLYVTLNYMSWLDCILYKYIIYMWQAGGYTQGAISGVSHGYEHALLVRRRSASLQNIKIFYTFCIQGNILPRLFLPQLSQGEFKTGGISNYLFKLLC